MNIGPNEVGYVFIAFGLLTIIVSYIETLYCRNDFTSWFAEYSMPMAVIAVVAGGALSITSQPWMAGLSYVLLIAVDFCISPHYGAIQLPSTNWIHQWEWRLWD